MIFYKKYHNVYKCCGALFLQIKHATCIVLIVLLNMATLYATPVAPTVCNPAKIQIPKTCKNPTYSNGQFGASCSYDCACPNGTAGCSCNNQNTFAMDCDDNGLPLGNLALLNVSGTLIHASIPNGCTSASYKDGSLTVTCNSPSGQSIKTTIPYPVDLNGELPGGNLVLLNTNGAIQYVVLPATCNYHLATLQNNVLTVPCVNSANMPVTNKIPLTFNPDGSPIGNPLFINVDGRLSVFGLPQQCPSNGAAYVNGVVSVSCLDPEKK
jgi:hypothetical protein